MKTASRTFVSTISLALLLGTSSFAIAQDQTQAQDQPQTEAQDQSQRGGYMATQTHPATPGMWDLQTIEESLTEQGYRDISDLREEDGQWRFTATRDLTFDPRTGQVVDPAQQQAAEAAAQNGQQTGDYMATQTQPASPEMWDPEALEQSLAQEGFSDVSEIRREGAQWQFTARRDEQNMNLTFDPQSGEIRDEADQRLGALTPPATPPRGGYMATQQQPATRAMWELEDLENQVTELGYSDVSEVRQEGGQLSLNARKDDQTVTLIIDPQTGEIFAQERVGQLPESRRGDSGAGDQQQR